MFKTPAIIANKVSNRAGCAVNELAWNVLWLNFICSISKFIRFFIISLM